MPKEAYQGAQVAAKSRGRVLSLAVREQRELCPARLAEPVLDLAQQVSPRQEQESPAWVRRPAAAEQQEASLREAQQIPQAPPAGVEAQEAAPA